MMGINQTKTMGTGMRALVILPAVAVMVITLVMPGYLPISQEASAAPVKAERSSKILEIKFNDDSDIVAKGNTFHGTGAAAVNDVLAKARIQKNSSLFGQDKKTLKDLRKNLLAENKQVADLGQYYQIEISDNQDIDAISAQLEALPEVQYAYPQALPVASPDSPSWQNSQFHRQAAPAGVDTNGVATWPGAKGGRVKVVDVEYAWNVDHEDISKARVAGASLVNGTPNDPFNDTGHGTAVIGILSADSNTIGVTGEVTEAQLAMVNTATTTGYNPANAINAARANMAAGDVMLIEQQTGGPAVATNDYVPLEWIPSVYDAIKLATATNITVVEAAGNGNQDLNDTALFGAPFPSGKADSGAIIVGASGACSSGTTPLNARMSFSTYGSRVNLHAAGECVITTGGNNNLYNNSLNENYTYTFSGTSSASAIIAGAATAYNSAYEQLNNTAPTAASVRSALATNGTLQNTTSGTLAGNIGPMPNLDKALLLTDRTAPTAPTSLVGTLTNNQPVLSWKAATDNVGVTGYQIYRNNVLIQTIAPDTTYTDTTATAGTKKYYVKAIDKAGRVSSASSTISVSVR